MQTTISDAQTDPFRHPNLLDANRSALVVVDMQESFLAVMHNREMLCANVHLLITAARLLSVPILLTTQYAERMGDVVGAVRGAIAGPAAEGQNAESAMPLTLDKMAFSCLGSAPFRDALAALQRPQVLLCGLETHICISQTAHDLAHARYDVHVAPDAVSSRTVEKHKLGMERIRDAGVRPVCAEAAVYEWLREAGTPAFKAILPLVR